VTDEEEQWSPNGFRAMAYALGQPSSDPAPRYLPSPAASLVNDRKEKRMKGSDKPKKLAKKAPQKTLKEKRSAKKSKKGNSSLT
jgi:hypothetical protein